jgi:hypothetical protein
MLFTLLPLRLLLHPLAVCAASDFTPAPPRWQVDEEGTEAAAATAVVMLRSAMPMHRQAVEGAQVGAAATHGHLMFVASQR